MPDLGCYVELVNQPLVSALHPPGS